MALAPTVARAADVIAPGASGGVYAAVGAFLGQVVSAAIGRKHARAAVNSHEDRCRAYRPPLAARIEED
jgi:hypothetical protein